jgi:hypothetical protein
MSGRPGAGNGIGHGLVVKVGGGCIENGSGAKGETEI